MPFFIDETLTRCGLMEAFRSRPASQHNEYLGRILPTKQSEIRERRLEHMLAKLASDGTGRNRFNHARSGPRSL
jgi:hypothetical protein